MKDRTHRDFTEDDIDTMTDTYHNWISESNYEDIKWFCKSADIDELKKHDFILTPGRYVGIPDEIDDGIPFEDKMSDLTKQLAQQMAQEEALNKEIADQLKKIGFTLE